MADTNPFDALDEASSAASSSNPFDALDEAPAQASTAARMQEVTDQAQIPSVTVSARRPGPDATWSQVAGGIPTAIGAGIETKLAGTQEYLGRSAYDDSRKKLWQALILPEAVRDAQKQNVALTDLPIVQDTAQHLGIRPDVFTRDWPTYVNMTDQERGQVYQDQRDRIQASSQQIASASKRRLTAAQVQEAYAPRMDNSALKRVVFDSATMAPDLLAGVGATVATGGVGGAAVMAADIAPNEYANALNQGADHKTASTYALLSTLAASVPEVPVLKVVENTPLARKVIGSVVGEKLAQTGIGKVAGTAAAQGVTQSVVSALQQGIDAGVLNQHLPLDEALKQVAWSGLVGAVAGAPMGAYHALSTRRPAPGSSSVGTESAAPGATPRGEPVSPEGSATAPEEQGEAVAEEPQHEPLEQPQAQAPAPEAPARAVAPTPEDEHAALQAVKDKTVTPPQIELLESRGLVKRNDLNEPVLLPIGRRRLTALAKQLTPETEAPAAKEAKTTAPEPEKAPETPVSAPETPPEPEKQAEVPQEEPEVPKTKPVVVRRPPEEVEKQAAALQSRVASDPDLRAGLEAMKGETGWAEVGGKLLRDATTGEAAGRTSWIPNSDWWPGRPKGLKESEVHAAVDKVLNGQPLKKRELDMVQYMAEVHDQRQALDPFLPTQEDMPADYDLAKSTDPAGDAHETAMVARLSELDEGKLESLAKEHEDDRNAFLAAVKAHLDEHDRQTTGPSGEERQEAPPAKRQGFRPDLFGEDTRSAQALADETRRRDAARSPNREVPLETGNPFDLFSQARRQVDLTDALKEARRETETEPTEAQKQAGNYPKGELNFGGMKVTLENPKGSVRRGVDQEGKSWESKLAHDYGYINRTEGADGDHVDAFLTGKPDTGKVFVVNQVNPKTGRFDEHKVVLGAATEQEARETYEANYPNGWKGAESIAEFSTPEFHRWVHSDEPAHGPIRPPSKLDRRTEAARRKKVAEMSAEEAKRELLTHELTGIPNRRAYAEVEKLPHQISIDVDSLKWVNDNMGHGSGNELLKAVASSLASHTEHAFHLSGDEFVSQAHTETEAHELMRNVAEHLKGASIEVEMPDGRLVKLKGLGVSYGVGKNLEEADAALSAHKTRRQAEGARAARGETPPGAIVRTREEGRQNQAGGPTEGVEPKSRRTEPSAGLPRSTVERIVHQTVREANLVAGFPHVEVHSDVSTLPQSIKRVVEQQGAESLTGALYDPSTGRIHLIASNNASEGEVRENLWHEAVGHHGLRMVMEGPQYNAVMDGIARDMPERVEAAARRNGLDLDDVTQKRAAAEEVIAYAAGQHLSGQAIDKPVLPYWKRAVRAVKSFFARMTGKPFYDDNAIAALIQQARQALERGTAGSTPGEPMRSTRAPRFYSPVERAVTASKQAKASADQWLATIKKSAGIKPDELEWLNLEPWLKEHTGPITREELGDYIRANQLHLEETLHGAGAQTADEREQIRLAEELRAEGHTVQFDNHGNLEFVALPRDERSGIRQRDMYYPDDPVDMEELPESIRERVRALDDVSTRVATRWAAEREDNTAVEERGTKYSEYTLPGGKNYRELLLRMPESPSRVIGPNGEILSTHSTIEEARSQAIAAAGRRVHTSDYRSSHWDEPNILAHVRFKERTDPEGRKVLHIEEIQSDWHQQGRQRGYRSTTDDRIPTTATKVLSHRTIQGEEVYHYEVRDQNGGFITNVTSISPGGESEVAALAEARRRLAGSRNQIAADQRVPDAPFKTSWPMLVMKRMVRWAAENGFDRIAWTTGRQQAERYNLAGDIQRIVHSPVPINENAAGNKQLYRVNVFGNDGRLLWQTPGASYETVKETLGKDIADQIVAGHGEEYEHFGRVLRGMDLENAEFGGSGMKGFYDDILPRETNKLIKKYGAKVGSVELEDPSAIISQLEERAAELKRRITSAPLDVVPSMFGRDQYSQDQREYTEVRNRIRELENQKIGPVHGFDVTPQMHQAALSEGFPLFSRRQQPLPLEEQKERGAYAVIRRAVNAVHDSAGVRDIRKLINPAGMSAEALQTASVAREALGQLAHETVKTQEALEHFSREVDKMPVVDQLAMMDAIEKGEEQPNPELQPIADGMRKMLDTWRTKVQGLGEGYLDNFIENYFPHYWRFPDEAQRMVASIMGRRPLRGPASFLKMRTIPSIKEGMEAGLTPLTTNPLIMTLLKTREMQRFVTGVTLMKRFKEDGLARFLPAGTPMPDGWAPINDNIAKVRQWSEVENGFIERGQYIMPLEAARVINNHVSASALRDFAPAQIFRRGANALNAMQLGFSAFHLGFTTLDAMISKNAQGIERMLHGDIGGAARSFGEGLTPIGAVTNVRRGYKLLQAYTDPAGATPEMQKLVRMLEMAGGRAHMDRYYLATEGFSPFRGVGIRSLVSDVRAALTAPQDKLENAAKALSSFPAEYANKLWRGMQEIWATTPKLEVPVEVAMRVVRASTAWIMEHLVPMQKLGVFSDLASDHLRRNPLEDPNDRAAAMQRIWDSVDNRLGEMVYDNLFWNRTLKDSLHLAVRAVGWNAGTVREIGGAPIDIVKAVDKAIRTGKISADDLGHRIPYVIAMTATTALYAAAYQYLATGQGPDELKDYFFPKTGGTTNYGTPERVSLPSYVKDVYEYSQRPGTTVVNKLNPIFAMIGSLYSNQDFFGNPITDPEAGYWKQKLQQLEYVGKESTPFSLQGRQQMKQTDQGTGFGAAMKRTLPMVGVTPAPGYITSGEQLERRQRYEADQKYVRDLKYQMQKALTAKDAKKAADLRDEYVEALKRMNKTKAQVEQDRAKAAAARRKAATTMRDAGHPAMANLVASLPLDPDATARTYFAQIAQAS